VQYDDIIVGGGSAGAVLAARLSEDPARRIVLVEAGPDYPTLASTPDDLLDCWRMSLRAHDWGLTAEAVPGRAIPYPRGRVIGGSSAHEDGASTLVPGLYFCGVHFLRKRKSALLIGVGEDAALVASKVAQRGAIPAAV
jgi:choline dehydrogenase-like flavoprotein